MEVVAVIKTARELGLVGCTRCSRVWEAGRETCGLCGKRLASRDTLSLQRVWAWWLVGFACYIPANLYPMLTTRTLGRAREDTIIEGAVDLAHHGNWGIAIVILVASVLIPVGKFVAVAALALGVQYRMQLSPARRHQIYEVVEYIGRWSMIDVFVVAILSSLVQLQVLASVNPGRASLFFALSVIFTMLSAQSFDSRLIWDADRNPEPAPGAGTDLTFERRPTRAG